MDVRLETVVMVNERNDPNNQTIVEPKGLPIFQRAKGLYEFFFNQKGQPLRPNYLQHPMLMPNKAQ